MKEGDKQALGGRGKISQAALFENMVRMVKKSASSLSFWGKGECAMQARGEDAILQLGRDNSMSQLLVI